MPRDSAQAYYAKDGMTIDNIRNFSAVPNGGTSTIRRGITRSKKALGRRNGQKPDYTITFDRDVLEGTQDFDWIGIKEASESFSLAEIADALTRNYVECKIETIAPSADDDGNVSETITISCLDMYVVQ